MISQELPAQLTPGFLVVHANQPEQLRALIVQWLKAYPLDIFETETILVQSNGIAQWLKLALAADQDEGSLLSGGLGIASGLSLQMPGRFIWQLYRWLMADAEIPTTSIFDKDRLRWRLLRLLPKLATQNEFSALASYIQHDTVAQKTNQLALKLADLFDQYQVYRADWLQDWAQGKFQLRDAQGFIQPLPDDQRWQALLWQAVLADLPQGEDQFSRAQLHQDFLGRAASYNLYNRPVQLPRRVILFGISSLPQQTLEALAAIAPYTQILLAVHNPCQHYWADIIADKDLFKAQHHRQPHKLALGTFANEHSQPLLAAWGKQGRDYIRLLDQFDQTREHRTLFHGERIDLFTAPTTEHLLGQVQHDIFDLTPNQLGRWPTVAEHDHSLVFVKAHSVLREVEILHDDILAQLQQDPSLQFSDFMVMVPDINQYAAAIHAVFGRLTREDSRYIPYTIADQAELQQDPLLQGLQYLLQLRQQRFGVSEIIDLLQVPAIAARFKFDEQALETLNNWLLQANVRWGLHGRQRQSLGVTLNFDNFSLLSGLRQMLAGYALGGNDPWGDVVPLTDVSGLTAEIAGQFALLCQQLDDCWQQSSALKTPEQWQQQLLTWLDAWFVAQNEHEQSVLMRLQIALAEWVHCCQDGGFLAPIDLSIVATAWLEGFSQQSLQQKFLAGAVNFATLMPMRAIPFAQIHLLGMNDGDFPRQSQRQDFDLMASSYRPGDRARRDDDRYLFLEALLSARSRLRISWVGHSIHDNSEREPSVLVAQLRDHIQQGWQHATQTDLLAALTVSHPLQAFSKRYLQNQGVVSFQHEWRTLHRHPIQTEAETNAETKAEIKADGELLPELPVEFVNRTWDLNQLTDFMRQPVRFFFRQRLKVNLQSLEIPIPDSEDFSQDTLQYWQMQQELSQGLSHTLKTNGDATAFLHQAINRFGLQDKLGYGAAGQLQSQQMANELMSQLARYQTAMAQTSARTVDELVFLQYQQFGDWFTDLRSDAAGNAVQLQWSVSALKKDNQWQLKTLIKPWLMLQISTAAGSPVHPWIIASDGILKLPTLNQPQAKQRLILLQELLYQGLQQPLPLEIGMASIWLQAATDTEKKLQKMQTSYQGDSFHKGALSYDPYLLRAFGNFADFWHQPLAAQLPQQFYQAMLDDANAGECIDANA